MIEDTPGYRKMMRMTNDDFLKIIRLVEPVCTSLSKDLFLRCSISLPLLCFHTRLSIFSVSISPIPPMSTKASSSFAILKYWTNDGGKQDTVSMDTSCWASPVHMHVPNMMDSLFDTTVQMNKNITHQTQEQEKCLSCLIICLIALIARWRLLSGHQTSWPNGEMFGH